MTAIIRTDDGDAPQHIEAETPFISTTEISDLGSDVSLSRELRLEVENGPVSIDTINIATNPVWGSLVESLDKQLRDLVAREDDVKQADEKEISELAGEVFKTSVDLARTTSIIDGHNLAPGTIRDFIANAKGIDSESSNMSDENCWFAVTSRDVGLLDRTYTTLAKAYRGNTRGSSLQYERAGNMLPSEFIPKVGLVSRAYSLLGETVKAAHTLDDIDETFKTEDADVDVSRQRLDDARIALWQNIVETDAHEIAQVRDIYQELRQMHDPDKQRQLAFLITNALIGRQRAESFDHHVVNEYVLSSQPRKADSESILDRVQSDWNDTGLEGESGIVHRAVEEENHSLLVAERWVEFFTVSQRADILERAMTHIVESSLPQHEQARLLVDLHQGAEAAFRQFDVRTLDLYQTAVNMVSEDINRSASNTEHQRLYDRRAREEIAKSLGSIPLFSGSKRFREAAEKRSEEIDRLAESGKHMLPFLYLEGAMVSPREEQAEDLLDMAYRAYSDNLMPDSNVDKAAHVRALIWQQRAVQASARLHGPDEARMLASSFFTIPDNLERFTLEAAPPIVDAFLREGRVGEAQVFVNRQLVALKHYGLNDMTNFMKRVVDESSRDGAVQVEGQDSSKDVFLDAFGWTDER